METKNFITNHIEFKFTRNQYPLNEKLICYFHIPSTGIHQPQVGDWVGLFKLGWNSLNEHRVRKLIQSELLDTRRRANIDYGHVVFEQHELPRDITGLYQFVYVTKDDIIRGASKPFQFERILVKDESRVNSIVNVENVLQQQRRQEVVQQLHELEEVQEQIQQQLKQHKLQQQELEELERIYEQLQDQKQRQQRLAVLLEKPEGTTRSVVPETKEIIVDDIESELVKERLGLGLNRMIESNLVNKMVNKYLVDVDSINKEIDFPRQPEELMIENRKLTSSLKLRVQEVAELRRETEEIKLINTELMTKLSSYERRIEQLEREVESRRIEELMREPLVPELSGKPCNCDKVVSDLLTKLTVAERRVEQLERERERFDIVRGRRVERLVEEPLVSEQLISGKPYQPERMINDLLTKLSIVEQQQQQLESLRDNIRGRRVENLIKESLVPEQIQPKPVSYERVMNDFLNRFPVEERKIEQLETIRPRRIDLVREQLVGEQLESIRPSNIEKVLPEIVNPLRSGLYLRK